MNTYLKKTLSVLLALLMLVTMVPYVSLGADEEAGTAIVFFKVGNDSYGDFVVYAYSFNEDQTISDLGSWPGKAMDAVEGEDGYYSCVIPADTYGLVFSREGVPAVQTPDIIYSEEYNGKCYDYESNEWIAVDFSGDKVKGMPLTIDVGTDTNINIGQGEKYYDEDGYIITGDDSDCMVTINESCNITLRDVTTGQLRFGYAPADSVFNITLEGENEITDRVMVYKNYMTFDGDEDAYFVAPFLNDSGNGTEITINGGNIELSSECTPLNCTALTINGGTVTAESNAEQSVCVDQLILNGGQLNVVNTSISFNAIRGNVIMNKDALLKISNSGKEIFDDHYEFTKGEDLGEDYYLFVRYDTEGGFALAKDILDALKGQSYVEIKVDFHEHAFEVGGYCDCGEACAHGSYTDSVCDVCGEACAHGSYTDSVCDVCGTACTHDSYTDSICDECGVDCPHTSYTDGACDGCGITDVFLNFELKDSYGDGWNGNSIVIKKLVMGKYAEVEKITIGSGDEYSYSVVLSAKDKFILVWEKGYYSDECSFTVKLNSEIILEASTAENFVNGELLYPECEHDFEGSTCKNCYIICGTDVEHVKENDSCTVCGKYVYRIKKQPTSKKPAVTLNNDTGATYQWYVADFKGVEITDKNATGNWEETVNDHSGGYGVYNKANGWSAYRGYYFIVKLEKGQVIKGEFSDKAYSPGLVEFDTEGNWTDDINLTVTDNRFMYVAEKEGYYGLTASDSMPMALSAADEEVEFEKAKVRAYVGELEFEAVEGATEATFENPETGKYYKCKVLCGDNVTVLETKVLAYDYAITHQPTEAEPYVELNNATDASYQWYLIDDGKTEITPDNARLVTSKEDIGKEQELLGQSEYNEEKGWIPGYYIINPVSFNYYFIVDLKAGDKVDFEFSNNMNSADFVDVETGAVYPLSCNGKQAVFIAEKDMTVVLHTLGEYAEVKAWFNEDPYIALEGETENTLKDYEYGNEYICEVTYGNGLSEFTSVLDYTYKITHQPTDEEPYVELNNDTDASYQWYQYKSNTEAITDESAYDIWREAVDNAYEHYYGAYEEGKGWNAENSYLFMKEMKAGEEIEFTFDFDTYSFDCLYYESKTAMYQFVTLFEEADYESYTFKAEKDGFYGFITSPESGYVNAVSRRTEYIKVDEEKSATFAKPVYSNYYLCEVTYANGTTEMSDVIHFDYKITHQPTEEEPYVEVNNDTDATYEWYTLKGKITKVDDKTATPRTDGGSLGNIAIYDSNTGWYGAWYESYDGGEEFNFFELYLEEGQTIIFDPDSSMTSVGIWSLDYDYTVDCDGAEFCSYTAEGDGLYYVWGISTETEAYLKAYLGEEIAHEKIDGANSATLENPVYGKCYTCKVTYANGKTEMSDIADFTYKITHQPTSVAPYVELNNDTDASYKWYSSEVKITEITDENAELVDVYEDMDFANVPEESILNAAAGYDKETGWSPLALDIYGTPASYYFKKQFNKGDKVTIEFSSEPSEFVLLNLNTDKICTAKVMDNKYELFIEEDGVYALCAAGEENTTEFFTVKAYVESKGSFEPLEGETSAVLGNPVFGTTYMCEVTAKDESVLETNKFLYRKAISSQPTEEDFSVKINDETATYQWYAVENKRVEITDEKAVSVSYEDVMSGGGAYTVESEKPAPSSYSKEDGWTPFAMKMIDGEIYGLIYFGIDIKKGETIGLEFDSDVSEIIISEGLHGSFGTVATNCSEYSYTADKDFTMYVAAYAEDIVNLRAYMDGREYTPVEGATESTFDPPVAGNYACEVTFDDGTKEMSETVFVEHVCDFTGDWLTDSKKHWKACECGAEAFEGEHHFTTYIVEAPATCTEEGLKVAVCDDGCGRTSEKGIPATNHQGTLVQVSAKAPTCKEIGWDAYEYCTACTYSTYEAKGTVDHKDANGDYKCDFGCGYEFTKPVTPTEPTTQPTTQAPVVTEPTTKPNVEDTTKPSTEPTTKPNVEDTTKPSTEPTTKPNVEDTTKPSTEPTTKPNVEDTTKPSTEPTTNPNVEDTTKPSSEPTTKPTEPEHKHTEVVVKGKAATCTENGLTDGKKCSVCGRITVAQKEIPATGHKEVTLKAVAATYTKNGKTEGKKCSVCGTITSAQRKVARKKLKKVTKVKVKKSTSSSVTLSWKKVTGADSYKVYYSTDGKKWKSVKVKKNTATIKKLKSGTQYRFKVRAFAGKYYGTASKIVKKTTRVKAPALSKVTSSKKKTATVTWKKVTRASGYVVEYSTSKKFTKKTTKTVKIKKGKTTKATLKKLKSGKKYYVRVKAYKTVNKKVVYGSYSKVKTVKVK